MPVIKKKCPDCEGESEFWFGDRAFDGRLSWASSEYCKSCHYSVEADDEGMLPDNLRDIELRQKGTWAVIFENYELNIAKTLKLIRDCLGLTVSDLKNIKNSLPGPIFPGTRAEAERFLFYFKGTDIDPKIVRFQQGIV